MAEIKKLLSDCNNVNQRDDHQATPLHFAAKYSTEALKLLIKAGADLNLMDADGDPPLEWADEKRIVENIRLLVNGGARWRKFSPLVLAGINGDITTLKSLSKDRKNIDQSDDHQATPLHYFAAYATKEAVDLLIKAGADMKALDEDFQRPIFWAAESGRIDIIQLLRADEIEGRITSSYELAKSAVKKGQTEVVKYLFSTDNDEREKGEHRIKRNRSELLRIAITNKQIEMLKFLLDSEFLLDSGIDRRYTLFEALIDAVETGQIESIKILKEHGAEMCNPYGLGRYPVDVLFEQGWRPNLILEVLKVLVTVPEGKSKTDFCYWSFGSLFMDNLNESFVLNALKILIPAGVNVNQRLHTTKYGSYYWEKTPLFLALEKEYNMAVRFLREHGAQK